MNPEFWAGMASTAILAVTLALALVLVVRRPVRRWLGPRPAYALWALVPAALVAALLPNPQPSFELIQLGASIASGTTSSVTETAPAGTSGTSWLLLAWTLGALASWMMMLAQEWRFRAALGALKREANGCWRATHAMPCPALIGLFRPRVVIPPDFELRWTERQQVLVIAHERTHARRGDPWANAAAAVLVGVFWFHPLAWLGIRSFRADQEMACDARVLADHPQWPRSYAEALLVPAGGCHATACRWSSHHSMKERIKMLNRIQALSGRKTLGLIAVGALTLTVVGAVWSAAIVDQGENDRRYFTVVSQVTVDEDNRSYEHRYALAGQAGQLFGMDSEVGPHGTLSQTFTFQELDNDLIDLRMTISIAGETVQTPRLIFPLDQPDPAVISTQGWPGMNLRLEITASSQPLER